MSDEIWQIVAKFDEILKKFNKIHNLTNYKDIKPVALDSIEPIKFLGFEPKVCVDVGSGAGFPAIFLAMILRECEFHLYEPIAKKSSFLSYVSGYLKLQNITIHSQKLENSKKKLKFSDKNCIFFRKTDYFCGHIGTTLLLITIFKCYSL